MSELETFSAAAFSDLSLSLFREVSLDKALAAITAQSSSESPSNSTFSVGAVYARVVLQNDPSAASELRSFFTSAASHHASQTGMYVRSSVCLVVCLTVYVCLFIFVLIVCLTANLFDCSFVCQSI